MSLVTQTETRIKIPSPNTLFKLFRAINSQYAWSTNLTLSLKQLELVGFLKPCTLLVCGSSVHINSLHKAWINNQIIGPAGYQVNCLGELSSLHIELINSLPGKPLPDTLYHLIGRLNNSKVPATVASLMAELHKYYQCLHSQPPTDQLVFETLNSMVTEKELVLKGS
ncbi:hypothetical protein EB796_022347 [Bugula neritina]|uniref:Uncharacterized protein n=1 Tax=Bugula neritina TaxID=10212 RepID=A0A7J7IZR1_BUGNE|nr:hypothetical protein EB796_022347 [Bugula neritina]